MQPDSVIKEALEALAQARSHFQNAVERKLILGNDNHIGDIGEYWVRRFYEVRSEFKEYGPAKNSPYDIELVSGAKVSVKTITKWSKTGYGTQVKPLCGTDWTILAAVLLDSDLHPSKISLVSIHQLVQVEPFLSNEGRRLTKGTSAYPRFQWWDWLDKHCVYTREQSKGTPIDS
jgi:hypothetical protein